MAIGDARWGYAIRARVVFSDGYSQLALGHRRAQGACRGQLQCAQNRSGATEHRVARGCTTDVAAGRGQCSNVGAEVAAEASGGVAATGGARTSDTAHNETVRVRKRSVSECEQSDAVQSTLDAEV